MDFLVQYGVLVEYWDKFLTGTTNTVVIAAISIAIGTAIACVIAYLLNYGGSVSRLLCSSYVELVRNTPLLAQLFLFFFGLPAVGIRMSANLTAVVGLTFNFAAYCADILRAGVKSVSAGQREAGFALALSPLQVFRLVVLRQAFAAVYPAISAQCVLVVLGSAAISTISANDLSSAAADIQSETFLPFQVYLVATLIYAVLGLALYAALDVVGHVAFRGTRTGLR